MLCNTWSTFNISALAGNLQLISFNVNKPYFNDLDTANQCKIESPHTILSLSEQISPIHNRTIPIPVLSNFCGAIFCTYKQIEHMCCHHCSLDALYLYHAYTPDRMLLPAVVKKVLKLINYYYKYNIGHCWYLVLDCSEIALFIGGGWALNSMSNMKQCLHHSQDV